MFNDWVLMIGSAIFFAIFNIDHTDHNAVLIGKLSAVYK